MAAKRKVLESYAGVPHLKGDPAYNQALGAIVKSTHRGRAIGFGGFSSLFDLTQLKIKKPLIVSSTDGVGTKLEIASLQNRHDTIGIDLVAMCVNDLITCGARPLFFLDYFATGAFDQKRTLNVVRGIAEGCRQAECSLIGGETAIMPGFYGGEKYDLAGFSVGVVEKSKVIDGRKVKPGDVLIGLESSGFHSNGYSLIRKVFTKKELAGPVGKRLLEPTLIYVRPVLDLLKRTEINAIANITGGGMVDNLPRVLPKGLGAVIRLKAWPVSQLFGEVRIRAKYSQAKMFHTFNMGIGMVIVAKPKNVFHIQHLLEKWKVRSWMIGNVDRSGSISIV